MLSHLPDVLLAFEQHHGGELQEAHYDGALAVVVELFLMRAKV